jgi:hypothetical protein
VFGLDISQYKNRTTHLVSNSLNTDEFLLGFSLEVNEIASNNGAKLTRLLREPYLSIYNGFLDVGRTVYLRDDVVNNIVIICNDRYGIIFWFWNDTTSFGSFQAQGHVSMVHYFFEFKD